MSVVCRAEPDEARQDTDTEDKTLVSNKIRTPLVFFGIFATPPDLRKALALIINGN